MSKPSETSERARNNSSVGLTFLEIAFRGVLGTRGVTCQDS